MLFARGVILVEGDAERFLVPGFAEKLEKPLDKLGITVSSVGGTNFVPYAKFLASLSIPFAIATDWDPREGKTPLGYNRALKLVETIERANKKNPVAVIAELKAINDYNDLSDRCETFGVFTNSHTLEVDLFKEEFREAMLEMLREGGFGPERSAWIDEWEADPDTVDIERLLSLIEDMGKGRFAQGLASRTGDLDPPHYLAAAIEFVADRV